MKIILVLTLILSVASLAMSLSIKDSPSPAMAQVILNVVPPGCGWIPNEKGPGRHTLICNGGTLRGFQDWEGGRYVPGHKNSLNVNISGGSAKHRGYVVFSPDNGKGSIFQDGHLNKLALFRGNRYGGTEFRIAPKFKRGLIVCNDAGENCVDLYAALKQLEQLPKVDLPIP